MIYPGADGAFTLYEDDGETTAYQEGAYAKTRFEVTDTQGAVICRLEERRGSFASYQPPRSIVLNIHNQPQIHAVDSDGGLILPLPSAESLQLADVGWWWNEEKQTVSVKLEQSAKARIVTVS